MLIDVYGLGYSPGEPEPERPALFYRGSTEVERRVMVDTSSRRWRRHAGSECRSSI